MRSVGKFERCIRKQLVQRAVPASPIGDLRVQLRRIFRVLPEVALDERIECTVSARVQIRIQRRRLQREAERACVERERPDDGGCFEEGGGNGKLRRCL